MDFSHGNSSLRSILHGHIPNSICSVCFFFLIHTALKKLTRLFLTTFDLWPLSWIEVLQAVNNIISTLSPHNVGRGPACKCPVPINTCSRLSQHCSLLIVAYLSTWHIYNNVIQQCNWTETRIWLFGSLPLWQASQLVVYFGYVHMLVGTFFLITDNSI